MEIVVECENKYEDGFSGDEDVVRKKRSISSLPALKRSEPKDPLEKPFRSFDVCEVFLM